MAEKFSFSWEGTGILMAGAMGQGRDQKRQLWSHFHFVFVGAGSSFSILPAKTRYLELSGETKQSGSWKMVLSSKLLYREFKITKF